MKNNSGSDFAFFNRRVLIAFSFCLIGLVLTLMAIGLYPSGSAFAQGAKQMARNTSAPERLPMVGAVSQDRDLRALPYIAPNRESEERRRTRHPFSQTRSLEKNDPTRALKQVTQAAAMPTPIATFAGMNSTQSGCGCLPPDSHGDVGPNHYVESVNSSIKIFNKSGTALNGVNGTTYNSFFSAMGPTTPCGATQNNQGENQGDGFVLYDQLADRWLVSDFAFPPSGAINYQCIGVSKTSDPVAGGWWLYALPFDSSNPTWLGDYPKFGLWPDAYYLSVNLFDQTNAFQGVRVYALPRTAMINGTGAPNPGAVAFTVLPAGLGDAYSLVPATFRAGSGPPNGTAEYFMAIDSPANSGVVLTQVKTWRFHVDFATPGASTFGVGGNRAPNGLTTVNGFVDAFTATTTNLVPQNVTTAKLDTLGDKIMTPLVYQNLGGTESLWASHTINNNQNSTGPTAIRWYQFNVTGGTIPATPAQQQTFNNNADGLWRFMPSIGVDAQGNMAIGYSVSSSTTEPAIKYAGRLAADAANSLAQGEALLIAGGGHQTSPSGRWGDYSGMSIDPSDNLTFWHANEYYPVTGSATWNTRIGKFKFPSPPVPQLAVSHKTHGAAGDFDIALPLTGTPGIECRSGGMTQDYEVRITFANPVTVNGNPQAAVTTGTGNVGTGGVATGTVSINGSTVTVPLTNIANVQTISITLFGVSDGINPVGNVSVPMSVLIGDTTGNGAVNASDISNTKAGSGLMEASRRDVTVNGVVNASDVSLVKSKSGTGLP